MRKYNSKFIIFSLMILLQSFASCSSCSSSNTQYPINAIPEYGNQVKTSQQIEADQDFLNSVKGFEDQAFIELIDTGWWYLKQSDVDTAVKRFNQAWLIDSTRFESYWGFAAAEKERGNYKSSKKYYIKAMELCDDDEINIMLNQELVEVLGLIK